MIGVEMFASEYIDALRLHEQYWLVCNLLRRWSPIWGIRAWRAWRLPRQWPDGGLNEYRRKTRRRAVLTYAPIPDLTWPSKAPSLLHYAPCSSGGEQYSCLDIIADHTFLAVYTTRKKQNKHNDNQICPDLRNLILCNATQLLGRRGNIFLIFTFFQSTQPPVNFYSHLRWVRYAGKENETDEPWRTIKLFKIAVYYLETVTSFMFYAFSMFTRQ